MSGFMNTNNGNKKVNYFRLQVKTIILNKKFLVNKKPSRAAYIFSLELNLSKCFGLANYE